MPTCWIIAGPNGAGKTTFAPRVDGVRCFMNSGAVPQLVFEQSGQRRTVFDSQWFERLSKEAGL